MKQRNLLFIYTDEQRYDTLAAYGNSRIHMPNLNRLAETSTVFEEAYVTQPVCTPSRSSLLTGQWPHTNGLVANNVPLKPETRCLPEMVSENYRTAHYGKWHLGDEIWAQHGFQEWRAIEDQYSEHYSEGRDRNELSHYTKWLRDKHGLTPTDGMPYFDRQAATKLAEGHSKPAFLAEEACAFLERNKANPFILYVNFLEPHMPFTGPRDNQYDPAEIALPENYHDEPCDSSHPRVRARRRKCQEEYPDEESFRKLIARYWGLCSEVDTHAGRILDKVQELELDDNTIVVFTSDHGDMMGSHGMVAKTVMYQESVRVPMMIRLPGQKKQKRIKGPVSQIDMVPTLLELMGERIPDYVQGVSQAARISDGSSADRDVFIEWNGPNGASADLTVDGMSYDEVQRAMVDPVRTIVTTDGWRYSHSPLGYHELYNLNEDRLERNNLARDSRYAPLMEELRARIAQWRKETADIEQARNS